jgi:outer membrane lipoprotein carrier protein
VASRSRRLLPFGLLLSVFAGAALAGDEAGDRMDRALAGLSSLKAEFTQESLGKEGAHAERGRGVLWLKRPGRFRWDYLSPKQTIVCDGERLWLYDPDLAQVTVRRVRETLSETPAMLLLGEARLRERFSIRDGGTRDGVAWSILTPLDRATDFREIRIGFSGETLRRLEFTDKLNQQTRIEFSRVERNAPMADEVFRFTPPAGVDVLGPAQ